MSSILSRGEEERFHAGRLFTELEARVATLPSGEVREALAGSLARLKTELGPGPAPELVACPRCGEPGMRGATLCSSCWARLSPA